jgi:hypothetical protein
LNCQQKTTSCPVGPTFFTAFKNKGIHFPKAVVYYKNKFYVRTSHSVLLAFCALPALCRAAALLIGQGFAYHISIRRRLLRFSGETGSDKRVVYRLAFALFCPHTQPSI